MDVVSSPRAACGIGGFTGTLNRVVHATGTSSFFL